MNISLFRVLRTGFLLAPVLLATGPTSAQETASANQSLALVWFLQIDTDGDEAISGEELDAMRTRRFVQIDLDRDRALTPTEFMRDISNSELELIARREKRFAAMDSDGDGRVDVVEYMRFGAVVMSLLDHDGDGIIRRSEFTESVSPAE
jgi:Ca2+-binding EF-hand superfamily protein